MVSSTVGSPMKTCWKRRSRAGSFSIRSRYSSRVVAPIMCSSPRASIGLSMLPASIAESPPAPAPTTVCSSSMNVMIWPAASLISSSTAFSRSSNSPRYFAPASIAARSSDSSRRPLSESGTSPSTIRWARPSTTAVLPTPGSPMSTGLFLVRRLSTWITRRISASRPMTGSSRPSSAACVRSTENFSRDSYVDSAPALVTRRLPRTAETPSRRPSAVRPASSSTFLALDSTVASAISRWSVATYSSFMPVARSIAVASTRVRAADAAGRWTVAPLALGRPRTAASAAAARVATSTPALVTRLRVVPSSWRSRAASRWMGSVALCPAVVAATWATSIASRLRVVNFSAANWLIPTVGSSSRGFSDILADRRGDPLTQRS